MHYHARVLRLRHLGHVISPNSSYGHLVYFPYYLVSKEAGGAYTSPRISFVQSTAGGHQPKTVTYC